ncbi:helix-turn-helix domain-containing protein [Chryseobacterium indoltheticum]|uniref:helix-turn-helix domain-containing protein n=1 Tax=Chryseobacterium indoltheticum TaxID=254 RepID=UPI001912ED3C|nr:helix-turn-helix domain-containing protein [Chryseobacterium indoltheticum]QQQ29876.1 helix-turn-helix domain-containing protein [Chryseobacterium indoltheticum]
MSIQLYSHSKGDLEKAVEIILNKAQNFIVPSKNEESQPEDLISQTEASKFLHVSIPTIIEWRKNKNLPHYNFSGRFYYSKKELLEYGRRNRK